jgi:putative MATE family efflux protein
MLFTKKEITKIMVPLIIEQALAVTIGMVDSMMVASAGEAAVSGVSLVDTVNILLIYVFSALAGGGAVVISQYLGAKDYDKANSSSKQLVWTVFFASFFIMLISLIFRIQILGLIFGSIEPAVMKNAQIYFLFTAMSYPFLGVYNAGAAVFRAMGNSRISMIASTIMNLINVVGNAILIFGFHMGAAGAAIATLFSRIVGAILIMALVQQKKNLIYVDNVFRYKPDFDIIKRILRIGVPNSLENGMFHFGKLLTQSLIATFGTVQIAANAVGNTLASLQYIPGTAIGFTIVTVVGRCVGAGRKEEAKKYAARLVGVNYAILLGLSAVLCIFAKPLIGFYNLSPESTKIAYQLLLFHSVAVCSIWPVAFTLTNAFRAASDIKYPMILSAISMWVFRVGLSYVFSIYFGMGVFSVWFAMFCDWIFRTGVFAVRYVRGTWLTKYVAS